MFERMRLSIIAWRHKKTTVTQFRHPITPLLYIKRFVPSQQPPGWLLVQSSSFSLRVVPDHNLKVDLLTLRQSAQAIPYAFSYNLPLLHKRKLESWRAI